VVATLNHFEESHPKDDAELKSSARANSKNKSSNNKKAKQVHVQHVQQQQQQQVSSGSEEDYSSGSSTTNNKKEVPAVTSSSAPVSASEPAPPAEPAPAPVLIQQQQQGGGGGGKKSKKSSSQAPSSSSLPPIPQLERSLLTSPLTAEEIQSLIETLLEKQQLASNEDSSWTRSSRSTSAEPPLEQLRRQLTEATSRLEQEQSTVGSLQDSLRKLRTELTGERTRSASVKKQLEEVVASRTNELSQTTFKLRRLEAEKIETGRSLAAQYEVACKKLREENDVLSRELRAAREDNNQVQGQVKNLQSELGAHKTQFGHLSKFNRHD